MRNDSKALKIFDGVQGTIDGTLYADIFEDDRQIARALLVLPVYGLDDCKSPSKLNGIALFAGHSGKHYTVKLSVHKLWAMER